MFATLAGILLVCFAVLLTLLRFVVLPQIEHYRGDVERELAAAIELPVAIGAISARMQGMRPRLELRQLLVRDEAGRPALHLDNVTAVVAWSSLLHLEPRFHLLEIVAPTLAVRRDAKGHFFVAGLEVRADQSGPDISAWVLNQDTVAIRDAQLVWSDDARQAPPLVLQRLNLRLERGIFGHRFGLTAAPPPELATALDIRGKFRGDSIANIEQWRGELYSQVDYADLAGWHAWLDYPVALTRGRGAARIWLDFAGLRPSAITADVALADVQIRLAPKLAWLPLRQLSGRIALRQQNDEFELTTRQLALATSDGISVAPTDLRIARDATGGEFTANHIDFQAFSALAAHLPLPEDVRRQLVAYAPRGSLDQFRLRWRGQQWPFAKYTIKGGFTQLALASVGKQPGMSGFSGSIDGDEQGGKLLLNGRQATLHLPTVFHQPLSFDSFDARMRWQRRAKITELTLNEVRFANADTEGEANGRYEIHEQGMGSIDLDARLTRAEAAAVWRYMPLQAGTAVGPFLHAGLTQGKVTQATLKLKGDLNRFPFADKSGVFRIHGVFHDAALHYAEGWPRIEGVAGEIDFDGPAMVINTSAASILGARVGMGKATIPDMESLDEQLLVEGKAAGATANFLKFIEASPIGARINHFTADMVASGNGELDLKLALPLRRLDHAVVEGRYRFDNNRLLLDPDMPPLDAVRGQLEFSAERLSARGVTATLFGQPLQLDLKTQSDGSVLAEVGGEINAAQLRKHVGHAALKNLVGGARWSGSVKARRKSAEVRITSDLVGLSSSLPEPFNKTAREAMPLLIERKALETPPASSRRAQDSTAARTLTELALGKALHAQLVHRQDGVADVLERGLVSVGDVATRLPEQGLTLAISQPRIDVDLWRAMLAGEGGDKPARAAPAGAMGDATMPDRIELRGAELQVLGRVFHDIRLGATHAGGNWTAEIGGREIAARLEWREGGQKDSNEGARLSGRISRFVLPAASVARDMSADSLKALPNLDLTLDKLTLDGRDYGELRLLAENKGDDWQASFTLRNEDAALEGQGRWHLAPGAGSRTQTDFKLHTQSIERFLNRLGHPNMVKRGSADLNGRLSWSGGPHEFDFASLDGQLALDMRNGQFNKLEPGVGRLLGVLSLQSVQRRLSLDFRDLFNEGLAFDRMRGQMNLAAGVMTLQNMEMRGPAARVQMSGNVDLVRETQDLKVRVQPTLSESMTTGALLLNPAVGATAWAFNKLFGNPLDNVFGYDFTVSGGWSDPKVEKAVAGGAQGEAGK